jgi:hypothetical protein
VFADGAGNAGPSPFDQGRLFRRLRALRRHPTPPIRRFIRT